MWGPGAGWVANQYLRHVFKELPKAQSVSEIEKLLPFNIDGDELNPVAAG